MRSAGIKSTLFYVFHSTQVLSIVAGGLVGAATKFDQPKEWFTKAIVIAYSQVQDSAGWFVPTMAAIAVAAKVGVAWVGEPWVLTSLQKLLDEYRNGVFEFDPSDGLNKHRVTLFRRKRCCWSGRKHLPLQCRWKFKDGEFPWRGWLVPVARSGHTNRSTKTVFFAPDDDAKAEGIAGKVWSGQRTFIVNELPELNSRSTEAEILDYSSRALASPDWIRWRIASGKLCPRSICGIYLEVNGKPWGVVILDSANPQGIRSKSHRWDGYERLAPVAFGELLKRA